ncbi:putative DNA-binding mobile mystery protein A [Acidovorax soli]|uniref:Putative DNA-binding mobile mystery protein A n=1 Tax=Acidovorax soli TaxID=592050 RepID=A0A7X0U6U1_9BURK|nr:helix-turn-helix domain-containing protein [Acidovorax soli]MBB6557462.1 putative DNA-binding mobile mystery protein A [Acidovorax soli]
MNIYRLAEIDRQLHEVGSLGAIKTPRSGWVKTLRLAMGMSSLALGERVAMSPQGVRKLERAEADGTIALRTLARLAEGLDCEVRYVLIPRTRLVNQVLRRAQEKSIDVGPLTGLGAASGSLDTEAVMQLSALLSGVNRRGFW